MYYVYYLKSLTSEKFHYIGCTNNVESRLKRHNRKSVIATKRFVPLELVGYKEFENRECAFDFERKLKASYNLRQEFIREIMLNAG